MIVPVYFGWFKLAFFGFILAEALARVGAGLIGVFSARRFAPLGRFGLGYLLGLFVLGTFFLALSCVGVFYPSVIALSVVILASISLKAERIRLLTIEAIGDTGIAGPGLLLLIIAAAASRNILLPVLNHDSYVYHMALPWQCLLMHKIAHANIPFTLHYPLPADMSFVLPMLLGDDRLAKLMVLFAFVSVCGIFADWCRLRKIQYASWVGPLLALSSGMVLTLMVQAKNDVPAAAFFVAGALMWIGRGWTLGGVLFGFSLAAKEIYLPLIAIFMTLHFSPALRRPQVLALVVVPLVPWLAKSLLTTGSPFFPFMTTMFPSFEWGERNRQILASFLDRVADTRWESIIGSIWEQLPDHFSLLATLLPAYFILKNSRNIFIACFLAMIVTVALINIPRYWLPAVWLMSLISALAVAKVADRFRVWAATFVAVMSLGQGIHILKPFSQPWREIFLSRDEFLSNRLTTYEESVRKLKEVEARRVVSVGERLVYRLPARILYGGQLGEMPLIWQLANESESVGRLAIKFRQLGISHLLHNYVSAEWVGLRYEAFIWDRRMLRMYVDFCKLHQDLLWRTETNNYEEGGMVLYGLRSAPISPKPRRIWFAPGTEQIYGLGTALRAHRKYAEFMELAKRNFAIIPDVGTAWNEMGYAYLLIGDAKMAYPYLKEFAEDGMMDALNLVNFGTAALGSGRFDEARRILTAAREKCWGEREIISNNLNRLERKNIEE